MNRTRSMLVVAVTVAVEMFMASTLIGCAGGYGEPEQLQRQVDQFNDQVRWGRYYSAANFVHDAAREEWVSSHRQWGGDLQIADYEIIDTTMEEDRQNAVILVTVSWYRLGQNELQTTVYAQRWRRDGRVWQLVSEEVENGTPI